MPVQVSYKKDVYYLPEQDKGRAGIQGNKLEQGWTDRSGYSGECRKDRLHKVEKTLNSDFGDLQNVHMKELALNL